MARKASAPTNYYISDEGVVITKDTPHCVQCGAPLTQSYYFRDQLKVAVCKVAKCPNYGLLQFGIEEMPK